MLENKLANTTAIVKEALSFQFKPVLLGVRTKYPIEKGWEKKYFEMSDDTIINRCIQQNLQVNVGILCGKPSGVLVVDVDIQDNGMKNFKNILSDNNKTIESFNTAYVETGSGGYHIYFKWNAKYEKLKAQLFNNGKPITGIDVKKNGQVVYPGSVYGKCSSIPHKCGGDDENCNFFEKKYKWIFSPRETHISEVPSWFEQYLYYNKENKKENFSALESTLNPKDKDEIYNILDKLYSLSCNFNSWRDMIWCIRSLGYTFEVAKYFSVKCPEKYDEERTKAIWNDYNSDFKYSKNYLYDKLREVGSDVTEHLIENRVNQTDIELLLNGNDSNLGQLFSKRNKKTVKITNSKSGDGYVWDENIKLWKKKTDVVICNMISDTFQDIIIESINQIVNNKNIDDKKKTKQIKHIEKKRDYILSKTGVKNILYMCVSDKRLYDEHFESELNQNDKLLPIKNKKCINLETKEVVERGPEHMFTFECPVNYILDTNRPHSLKFFKGICKDDEEYRKWMLKWLGYCLTGRIDDRAFYVLWGDGMNGKSTLINVINHIMNVFIVSVDKKILIDYGKNTGATPELVAIMGARICVCSELNKNESLRAELIKQITGGDTLAARQLFCEQINFKAKCKLILCTNEKPDFSFNDKALKDRIKLLPFLARFERNKKYEEELIEHIDELFSDIVDAGVSWWSDRELDPPKIVKQETEAYINENDTVASWMEENCTMEPNNKELFSEFYLKYNSYCIMSGVTAMTNKAFVRYFDNKGFRRVRGTANKSYIEGIKIN